MYRKTVLSLLALCLAIPGRAQIFSANVTGVVTDPTGSAIVNAQVRLLNSGTGEERTTATDPTCSRQVRVDHHGYRIQEIRDVRH